MDNQVDKLVDLLGCSIEEAQDIIASDKAIDKGERMEFDLSKEKEKEAKKFANVTTHKKPMVPNLPKKEKKADVTKEGVIEAIFNFLVENGYENCEILNKSKLIGFKIADDSYELDLKRKRKPKN